MSKGKRNRREEPAAEPTETILECIAEGCTLLGLHRFELPQGQVIPLCFKHLQMGLQDRMKKDINDSIFAEVAALELRIREHRSLGDPCLLVQMERELGMSPRVG